jgi:hypothetical protein
VALWGFQRMSSWPPEGLRQKSSGGDCPCALCTLPTANLDDRHRSKPVRQILNDKEHFSKLFVISYDDTFARDTDHVVRVVKGNGMSRVEA